MRIDNGQHRLAFGDTAPAVRGNLFGAVSIVLRPQHGEAIGEVLAEIDHARLVKLVGLEIHTCWNACPFGALPGT